MFEPHWMSSRVGGRVIEQNWEDMHPSLEAVAIRESFHSRFKRLRAIIEDLAYSGMSHQEIADKYGQEVEVEHVLVFAAAWAEIIDMARLNRYDELRHAVLMGEVEETLQMVARERELWRKILDQNAGVNWSRPDLN
jgi:hypothetical protein